MVSYCYWQVHWRHLGLANTLNSCLRQLFVTESPLKVMKNTFYCNYFCF